MPDNHEWQSRIKTVEREYTAMRHAADRFQKSATSDPTILTAALKHKDLTKASENLEGTYLIRLFAEFESGARQYWSSRRHTSPKTADLLQGLAAMRKVPDTIAENGHLVREYRNSLVHEREDALAPIPLDRARHHLCSFFSYLPPSW